MRCILVILAICFSFGEGAGYYGQVSSVLRSFRDADNIIHIIPQLVSSGVEFPVCFFSIANENTKTLCKVLCKTAGFQLCERSYRVAPYDRNNDKGYFVTVNCMGDEYNIGQCRWFSIYNVSCQYLLAIKCTDCNNSLKIYDELSVVTLPQYSPCGQEYACEWNISLQKEENKVTPIKFQSYKNILGNGSRTGKRIIALTWIDYQKETHFIEGTDENFTAKSLQIASDKFVLHYYAHNCNTLVAQERVQLVINGNQQPPGYINDETTARLVALILPLCLVVAGIVALIVCICYNIRNKARFQEYRLDAVSSYKSLNCLTGVTSPQKTTVEDYLVTPWGKDYKVHEENDEIQLGSITKYTINRKNNYDQESERKVKRSSSFGVKRKLPFTSKHKIKGDTAYSLKVRSENSDIHGCVENFSSLDSISEDRRRNLFSHVAHWLFPCIDKNASHSSISKLNSLQTEINELRDLEDSSLESVLCKFNSLVLSIHWSDTASENSGQTATSEIENLSLIEIMNKNAYVTSDFSSGQRHQLSEVPIPRNSGRASSLSKQLSSDTEPVYSCRNSELEPTYSCRSSESERSCFSVTQYGDGDYSCSEAGTFISFNTEASSPPINIQEYGSVQSL